MQETGNPSHSGTGATTPEFGSSLGRYLPPFYLGALWLTSSINISVFGFDNAPLNMLLVPVMFLYLPVRALKQAIWIAAALFAYEVLKAVQPGFFFTVKGLIGIVVFSSLLATAYNSLLAMTNFTEREVALWLRTVLWLIFLAIAIENVLSILGVEIDTPYHNYLFGINVYSGFFIEPSHVAIGLSPFVFMCVYDFRHFIRHMKISSLVLLLLLNIFCVSTTIIAIWFLAVLMIAGVRFLKGNIVYTLLAGAALCIAVWVSLTVPAVYIRIVGLFMFNPAASLSSMNASSLAFLKGLQMTAYAIRHFPLGVAFENMSYLAPQSIVSYLSNALYVLNSDDGTSILFKGICELGILFEVFGIAGFIYFIRRMGWAKPTNFYALTILSIQFAVFAHCIRSPSLFNGVLPIGFASLLFGILYGTRFGEIVRMPARWLSATRQPATAQPLSDQR